MGRNRFVTPNVVRLPISDEDWIDVKRELNAGEARQVFADVVKKHVAGEKVELDTKKVGLSRIVGYLLGWSFCDEQGKPVAISSSAIDNLDTDTYNEIVAALDAHEATEDTARADRKKSRDGASASSATSPSANG